MNDGRKNVDAEPAAAHQERAHARALGAGREFGRSNRRLPLYGGSPADTGAVRTSVVEIGFMATDGVRLPAVRSTMMRGPSHQPITNKPNDGQSMLASASDASGC